MEFLGPISANATNELPTLQSGPTAPPPGLGGWVKLCAMGHGSLVPKAPAGWSPYGWIAFWHKRLSIFCVIPRCGTNMGPSATRRLGTVTRTKVATVQKTQFHLHYYSYFVQLVASSDLIIDTRNLIQTTARLSNFVTHRKKPSTHCNIYQHNMLRFDFCAFSFKCSFCLFYFVFLDSSVQQRRMLKAIVSWWHWRDAGYRRVQEKAKELVIPRAPWHSCQEVTAMGIHAIFPNGDDQCQL